MKKNWIGAIFLCTLLNIYAQEDLSVNNYWMYNDDISYSLYNRICSYAFIQLKERRLHVNGLKTKDDWLKRQADVSRKLAEIVGEFPAKTPLNPVITGTVQKDDFIVEKLYFESLPGFYVTAALFLPAERKEKLPAILYCCGHTANGFRSETYQRNIINLVKKGFIVLTFDPISQGERLLYFDANGKSIFGAISQQHTYPGTQSFIAGRQLAYYFIWDGIRAIDYLVSRTEVDPARIGITGQSGGGTQTAYIAAMDDRILAAAPECWVTSFDKLLQSIGPQDAEQVLMNFLEKGLDKRDFIEVRAPKPTLIVATTRDFFSIQGTREAFQEAQHAYTAFGKPENLNMVEDDAEHSCTPKNREAIVAFFQKFLHNPGDPKEEDIELFDEKDLWVTPTGLVQTSLKGETIFSLNINYTAEVLGKLQSEKQNNPDFYKEIVHKAKSLTGYREPVISKDYLFSGRLWRDGYSIEKYALKGSGDYYIPVLRLSSENSNGKTVLLLDDQGKESAAAKGGLADRLAQKGYQVFIPDLSGSGELDKTYPRGGLIMKDVPLYTWYAGLLTHKTPLAIRIEEIKIITNFIQTSLSFGEGPGLKCIALGTLTPDLLHAALITQEFHQIALINPLISYQSIIQRKDYLPKFVLSAVPEVMGKYDLPDLVTALFPLKIFMLNPVDALGQTVDYNIFEQEYADAKQKYGDSPNLTIGFNENDIFLKIDQWLAQ
jgi:dienelactone hydrolase